MRATQAEHDTVIGFWAAQSWIIGVADDVLQKMLRAKHKGKSTEIWFVGFFFPYRKDLKNVHTMFHTALGWLDTAFFRETKLKKAYTYFK